MKKIHDPLVHPFDCIMDKLNEVVTLVKNLKKQEKAVNPSKKGKK